MSFKQKIKNISISIINYYKFSNLMINLHKNFTLLYSN